MGTPYGPFQFPLRLATGTKYELLTSTDLRNWVTLHSGTAAAESVDYVDSDAPKFSYRFYRVL
ncbi:MAG: hypothetical protein KGS61_21880, partial [Verrucomicrobia bacterium]|nr:hypothetical protein [Verrucomicrobiota bacterium]